MTFHLSRASVDVERAKFGLAVASLITLPLSPYEALWSEMPSAPEDFPHHTVVFTAFDIPLTCLLAVKVYELYRRGHSWRLPRSPGAILLAAALAWFLLSFLANPSWRGLEWWLRVGAAGALATTVAHAPGTRQRVFLRAVVCLGSLQALLALAQSRRGSTLGLVGLEWSRDLYSVGHEVAGRGSFPHPYFLSAFTLIGIVAGWLLFRTATDRRQKHWLAVALFVLAAGLGVTYSRASLLAILPIAAIWLSRRRDRIPAVAVIAGFFTISLLTFDGQAVMVEKTRAEDPSNGRRAMLADAVDLIEENPILGVGSARYAIASSKDAADTHPPHNLVVHAAVDGGIPGGALAAAGVLYLAYWTLKRGRHVTTAALAIAPFLMLDWFPYASPAGLVVSSTWAITIYISAQGAFLLQDRDPLRQAGDRASSTVVKN